MQSIRGNLIYTAFATAIFIGFQWFDGLRDITILSANGAIFFIFTFGMLRLIQRVMNMLMKGRTGPRARSSRDQQAPGPATMEPTTTRPDHVRRRRERRRRR